MVPSSDAIHNVRVIPLTGVQIEDDKVCELTLHVPATVGVQLVLNHKDTVAASTLGGRLGLLDWLVLLPLQRLEVERVNVTECNAGIA